MCARGPRCTAGTVVWYHYPGSLSVGGLVESLPHRHGSGDIDRRRWDSRLRGFGGIISRSFSPAQRRIVDLLDVAFGYLYAAPCSFTPTAL